MQVGLDVRANMDESRLNSGRILDSLAGRTRFTHFCAVYLIAFCSRLAAAIDVISSIRRICDKCVKFCDPRLNHSLSINTTPSNRRLHFRQFVRDNSRPEVVSDVISGVAVAQVGVDVRIKTTDSRSNPSRDI